MSIPKTQWEWFGYPGHFIAADRCLFRLCTKVGDYLISTVGDYWHLHERHAIGAGPDSFYETYVFKAGARCALPSCGCNMPMLADALEIEGERCATAGEAQALHLKYCEKYAGLQSWKDAEFDEVQP